jgi:hypothetical protein
VLTRGTTTSTSSRRRRSAKCSPSSGEYYSPSTQFGAGSEGRPGTQARAAHRRGARPAARNPRLLRGADGCLRPIWAGDPVAHRSTLATAKPTSGPVIRRHHGWDGRRLRCDRSAAALAPVGDHRRRGITSRRTAARSPTRPRARAYDGDLTTTLAEQQVVCHREVRRARHSRHRPHPRPRPEHPGAPGQGQLCRCRRTSPSTLQTRRCHVDGATAIGSKVAASGAVVFDAPTRLSTATSSSSTSPSSAPTPRGARFRAMVSEVQVLR